MNPTQAQLILACSHLATWLDGYVHPATVDELIAEVEDEGVRDVLEGVMGLVNEQ